MHYAVKLAIKPATYTGMLLIFKTALARSIGTRLLQALVIIPSLGSFNAYAEEIVIPVGQQGHSSAGLPHKGASKEAVMAQFGEPQSRTGPVGTPPISTWVYSDFSVYFEYNHVIHAVRKHTPQAPTQPSTSSPSAAEPVDIDDVAPADDNNPAE